jgi:PAS domain S-box-containing protein
MPVPGSAVVARISAFLAPFPAVLEQVPVMAWMTGVDGRCIFTNRIWLSFTGRTAEQQLGFGWTERVHPGDRNPCLAAYLQAHETRRPYRGEYRLQRRDGVYRVMEASGVPVYDPSGDFHGYVGLCTDITEQRGTVNELARTSDHLHLVATHADEMIYRLRVVPAPALEYVSPGSLRITGYPPEEFVTNIRLGLELVVPEDRPILRDLLADPAAAPRVVVIRWRHPDGRIVWAQHTRIAVRDADGRVIAIEGVARDISLQKELERERDDHSTLLTSLIATMNDAVLVESDEGRVLLANQALCHLLAIDRPPEALTGSEASGLSEQLRPWTSRFRSLKKRRLRSVGEEIPLSDGRVLELQYNPVHRGDSERVHVWQFRDITARKQFETELHTSRQRLRDLAAHDEAVREEERRGAARMLHDELGQLLTSVKLEVAAAADVFREHPDQERLGAVDRLQSAAGLLDVCIRTVRQVSAKLRPAPIPEMRISDALRCEALLFQQRTKIRCRASVSPAKLEVDPERSAVLYRVLVEALTNVARHAEAGAVQLSLKKSAGVVFLSVRDNGRGIAQQEIDNPSTMGLLGMRERALSVNGDVRITRGARGGTTVMLILPLLLEPSESATAADGRVRR